MTLSSIFTPVQSTVGVLTSSIVLLALAPGGEAQIPETYENLQVLPEDVSRDSLVSVMRGFALGLGVRCQYCHVGQEGEPFSEWDFPSDEKPEKRTARFMLEMVEYLNRERLASLPVTADVSRRDPPVTVSCETCHGGVAVPRPLEEVLAITIEDDGVEAAIEEYRELRARYHGTAAYDFSERRLLDLGNQLRTTDRAAAAVRILELNLESYPESGGTYVALYQSHDALGNREEAIAALEQAAVLLPGNESITRLLERLREGG